MLELDALLAPIAGAHPCGDDLSFSVEYDLIQEARRADDPSLEQGEWITDLKTADWPVVASRCAALLRERSKDLRLAGWWTEAQTRQHGFTGLTAGYRLVAALCARYWDEVHPQAEHGDYEQRIGNLGWLLEQSVPWLRAQPLVRSAQQRYTLADIEAAHARRDGGSAGDTASDIDAINAARRATPHDVYRQLLAEVGECGAALHELQQVVDAKLGQDGPAFTGARELLGHLLATAQRFAREAGMLVDGETGMQIGEAAIDTPHDPISDTHPAPAAAGAIATRKDAIAQLRRVADFFRRTEPHSPVAYLADKAARWGEMPLHVWLRQVIKDDSTLSQLEELLDAGDGGTR